MELQRRSWRQVSGLGQAPLHRPIHHAGDKAPYAGVVAPLSCVRFSHNFNIFRVRLTDSTGRLQYIYYEPEMQGALLAREPLTLYVGTIVGVHPRGVSEVNISWEKT